ncbi:MAG: signal peptidase I [Candidatus Kapabacteria bacterium]|nr:signal peptidase I [Candidatus Kapabacteria bacterium]
MFKKSIKPQQTKPATFSEKVISWIKTIVWALVVVMILNGVLIASFVVPTPSMENTVMTGDFLFVNKFIYGPSTPQVIPLLNIPLPFYKFPGIKDPKQGDVIVFIFPGNRDEVESKEFQYYLKRCVASAGDTLQVIDKHLIVNGKEFAMPEHAQYDSNEPYHSWEPFHTFPPERGYSRDNYGPIRIPKKGDVVQISTKNIHEWRIFIRREGHEVSTDGINVLIDGKASNSYTVQKNYCFGMGDNRDHSLDSRFWGFIPYDNVVGTPMIVYWSWDTNAPIGSILKKFASLRWNRIGKLIF